MKRILYILFVLSPFLVFAQSNLYNASMLDYSWQYVGQAGFSPGSASYNSLAFNSSGQMYIAFEDQTEANTLRVMNFDGTDWVSVGDTNANIGRSEFLDLAIDPTNGELYIAFQDLDDTLKATVKKFDGTSWVNVGEPGISSSLVYRLSLAVDQSGQPFLAFEQSYFPGSNKISVKKFNGINWEFVGNEGFPGPSNCPSLAFDSADQPYLAFVDWSGSASASVSLMKFNGTDWAYVGDAGFSPGEANNPRLEFNSLDQPYVAFIDGENTEKLSVMKFEGTNWVYEGAADFSSMMADFESFAISTSDQPYVSFRDSKNYARATVMKFDGDNWVNVGNAGLTPGFALYTSLAFNPVSGQAYLAFTDGAQNIEKASVMTYDSVFDGIAEPQRPEFRLYPNPGTTTLTINFNNTNKVSRSIAIYDVRWNNILEIQSKNDCIDLNVENYPSGIYFVRVRTENSNWIGRFCKY